MVSGYEVEMYHNIAVMTQAMRSIEKSLARIADAMEKQNEVREEQP